MTPSSIEKFQAETFVEASNDCQRVCSETADHCLTLGGAWADVRAIQMLRNCSRICRTGVASWSVGSRLSGEILRACANLCEDCATNCDQRIGDSQMQTCAESCRAFAEFCRDMAERPAPQTMSFPIRETAAVLIA